MSDFYDQKSTLKVEALQTRLDAVKDEISDCREAWAPDQPPTDLGLFLADIEVILRKHTVQGHGTG